MNDIERYRELVAQANSQNLLEPPPSIRGQAAAAWRSGYLSAIKDLTAGKLQSTPPPQEVV